MNFSQLNPWKCDTPIFNKKAFVQISLDELLKDQVTKFSSINSISKAFIKKSFLDIDFLQYENVMFTQCFQELYNWQSLTKSVYNKLLTKLSINYLLAIVHLIFYIDIGFSIILGKIRSFLENCDVPCFSQTFNNKNTSLAKLYKGRVAR